MFRFAPLLIVALACGGSSGPAKQTKPANDDHKQPVVVSEPTPPRRIVVAPPPTDAQFATAPDSVKGVDFTNLVSKRNKITDEDAWFEENALERPNMPRAGNGIADARDGVPLRASFAGGDRRLHLYEGEIGSSLLVVESPSGGVDVEFDLSALRPSTPATPEEAAFVQKQVRHAVVKDDVLYVCHAHSTYAKSSNGKNAYVTAYALSDGALLWHSQPLVCNSQNFVVHGPVLVTGYGFTAEPDFLYALDRANGKVVGKTKLKSGPEYLIEKDDVLFVRTYDTNSQCAVRVRQ